MSTAGCNKGFLSCIFSSEKQHIFDRLFLFARTLFDILDYIVTISQLGNIFQSLVYYIS